MKKILLLTTVTALLSSCGIYTKYQPETTAPDNLYGEGTAVVDTANLGNVDWRELFTDPRLQELIEQGLQSNTDYLSAQLRVEEAKATLLSAKLIRRLPFSTDAATADPAQYATLTEKLGGADNGATRLWWDTGKNSF